VVGASDRLSQRVVFLADRLEHGHSGAKRMRRLLIGSLLVGLIGCFPLMARADSGSVLVGLIEYDSNGPINSFYVTNLTDAYQDPGISTDVNFTNLAFSVTDSMGNSSGPGSPIADIPSAGNSADVFDTVATDLESATVTGAFDVTYVTLSDGTQVFIDPTFTATILPSCANVLIPDCDLAAIDAEIIPSTATPEPGTLLLISSALPLLGWLRRRSGRA
jgi:hypothetical protein